MWQMVTIYEANLSSNQSKPPIQYQLWLNMLKWIKDTDLNYKSQQKHRSNSATEYETDSTSNNYNKNEMTIKTNILCNYQ